MNNRQKINVEEGNGSLFNFHYYKNTLNLYNLKIVGTVKNLYTQHIEQIVKE